MAKKNEAAETKAIVQSTNHFLNKQSDQLQKWCVEGSGIDPVDLIRVGTMTVSREPKFQDPRVWPSLYLALLTAAQLGLNPSGVFGEGYIIPYWDPKLKHNVAQFQPGYRGLMKLVRQSGDIKSIRSVVVYSGDVFRFQEGSDPDVHHIIRTNGDRGKPVGAYSIAEYKDDSWDAIWVPQVDIDKASQNTPAWKQWPDEMAKKFAIKRHTKQLPMSPRAMTAVHVDNAPSPTEFDPDTGEVVDAEVVETEPEKPVSQLEAKLEERKKTRTKPSKEAAKPEAPAEKAPEEKPKASKKPEAPPKSEPDFPQCELCGDPAPKDADLCGPCAEGVKESEEG